jgi:hypothetical protein
MPGRGGPFRDPVGNDLPSPSIAVTKCATADITR